MSEFEKVGGRLVPVVAIYPEIRAGTCEFCGVIDPSKPADIQYQLCPHYKGKTVECTYCDASTNQLDVVRMSRIHIYAHPTIPGQKIAVCDRTECQKKHQERFR